MSTQIIKTIDINAKEWFDKVNGNSYFAAVVTINFGMADEKQIKVPFEYGYGEHYKDVSFNILCKEFGINTDLGYWQYCRDNGIILRANKQAKCKKSELKNI